MSVHDHSNPSKILCFVAVATLAALTGWGCASKADKLLEDARAVYNQAQQTPDILSHGSAPLTEAGEALEKAEKAEDEAEKEYLAREAKYKVGLAVMLAERKIAAKHIARLEGTQEEGGQEEVQRESREITDEQPTLSGATRTDRGLVLTLSSTAFKSGRAELTGEKEKLVPLVAFLKAHQKRKVLIEGHTDSTGSDTLNLSLSQRRANAVGDILISEGISASRITTKGYGESHPIADNATKAGRQKNRRVEIIVLDEGVKLGAMLR